MTNSLPSSFHFVSSILQSLKRVVCPPAHIHHSMTKSASPHSSSIKALDAAVNHNHPVDHYIHSPWPTSSSPPSSGRPDQVSFSSSESLLSSSSFPTATRTPPSTPWLHLPHPGTGRTQKELSSCSCSHCTSSSASLFTTICLLKQTE